MNFSFESLENLNKNIHFFDEKLLKSKTEKKISQQIGFLNAFQMNLNPKNNNAIKMDFGGVYNNSHDNNKFLKLIPENDQNFIKSWKILLDSIVFLRFFDLIFFFNLRI